MSESEINSQIEAIRKVGKEVTKSKEAAEKFIRDFHLPVGENIEEPQKKNEKPTD